MVRRTVFGIVLVLSGGGGCLRVEPSIFDASQGGMGALALVRLLGAPRPTKFIAYTETGTALESRGDGTWTTFTLPGTPDVFFARAVSEKVFVGRAVSPNVNEYLTSTDGKVWEVRTLSVGATGTIASLGGCGTRLIVADTGAANAVQTRVSLDGGSSWQALSQPTGGAPSIGLAGCHDSRLFVSGTAGATTVTRYSDDGSNWNNAGVFASVWNALAGLGTTVLLARDAGTGTEFALSSDAGANFAAPTMLAGFRFNGALSYTAGAFRSAMADASNCRFGASADGGAFTDVDVPCSGANPHRFNTIAALSAGTRTVLVAGGCDDFLTCASPRMFRSTDNGATWTQDTLPSGFTEIRAIVSMEE